MEAEILQRLRDSGIAWLIKTDGEMASGKIAPFKFRVGHSEMSMQSFNNLQEGIKWMAIKANEVWPDSGFSKWWKSQNGN